MSSRRLKRLGQGVAALTVLFMAAPAWSVSSPVAMTPEQCAAQPALGAGYIARYEVAGPKAQVSRLTLTHIPDWSAYDAGGATIRLWHALPGDDAELYRIFDDTQRSILYTSSGLALLKQSRPWHRVAELADTQAMKAAGEAQDACGRQRHYTQKTADQTIDVWAYVDSGLVTALTVRPATIDAAKPLITYRLAAIAGGPEAARAHVARWRGYQSTDFADIGDNESDPFLQRMIHHGFIEHAGHSH